MEYSANTSNTTQERGRARGTSAERHNGSGLNGVKRQAVSETTQKSQQGTGNGTMTNVAEEQTITVTYNFHF